jgi:hypothetical protein
MRPVATWTKGRARRTGLPGLDSFRGGVVEGEGEAGQLADGRDRAEVDESPAVLAVQQHDVAGLDVTVAVPAAVQVLQPHRHMRQHLHSLPLPSPRPSRTAS